MVDLLRHKVRFGELSWGPYLHYATFFDLLIRATEELTYELDDPIEGTVAAGGIPYAPVAIHGEIDRYPRYPDTVVVAGEPAAAGETNVQFDYRFLRASDGVEFGRATTVQVTITPEHAAAPVSAEVLERLRALGPLDREPSTIEPRALGDATGAAPEFERPVTFRTPHIEAAGLGYFEDYAREMAVCLEDALDAGGRSLRDLTGDTYPFVPVAWDLAIDRSIRFEDDVTIVGRVLDAGEEAVEVGYEFRRDGTGDVCIRSAVTYGSLDGDGRRVPFEPAALAAVTRR